MISSKTVLPSALLFASLAALAAPSMAEAKSADLGVSVSGPASVAPGTNVVYTVSVTNSGPNNATAVRVANSTPSGLTFVSNSGACTTTWPCSLGSVPNGATRTITSTYAVPTGYTAPNPIVNTVTVSGKLADPNAANNTAMVSTPLVSADLAITGSTPA